MDPKIIFDLVGKGDIDAVRRTLDENPWLVHVRNANKDAKASIRGSRRYCAVTGRPHNRLREIPTIALPKLGACFESRK